VKGKEKKRWKEHITANTEPLLKGIPAFQSIGIKESSSRGEVRSAALTHNASQPQQIGRTPYRFENNSTGCPIGHTGRERR